MTCAPLRRARTFFAVRPRHLPAWEGGPRIWRWWEWVRVEEELQQCKWKELWYLDVMSTGADLNPSMLPG